MSQSENEACRTLWADVARRTCRRWLAGSVVAVAAAAMACGGASDTARQSPGSRGSTAILSGGSAFEGSDGNLVVDTAGDNDWANPPGFKYAIDKPTGSNDDAFGQGAKEDVPNPSVVSGGIPNQKSDLTRFYLGHENIGGNFYLYLGWERANILGTANMDFEFNQSQTIDANGVTPVRTAGDMLITFDFTNGGTNPVIGLLRWVTTGATSQCYSSSSLPCWGNHSDLSGSSEAAVFPQVGCSADADCASLGPTATCTGPSDGKLKSTCATTDPAPTTPPNASAVNELTFGEAAINLTAAGVFVAGQCTNFANAYLKSRSSASFDAELKDFIAPLNANINNCATVDIHKQSDLNVAMAGIKLQLYDGSPNGTACTGNAVANKSCTTDLSGNCSILDIQPGTWCVAEDPTTLPAGYGLDSAKTVTVANGTATPSTLTFTDPRIFGAIKITKTSAKGNAPLPNVAFQVSGSSPTTSKSGTTGADGTACIDGLPFQSYTVTETPPDGYSYENPKTVSVSVAADCSANVASAATVSFVDTPLSQITVSFKSLAGPDVTSATIDCGAGFGGLGNLLEGTPKVLDNLLPGTYSCTVVVDP